MKLENRFHTQKFEIRSNQDGSRTVSGYAARFNSLSKDLGGFFERVSPGAFSDTLRDGNNKFLLYGHEMNNLLASTASGTLELKEDDNGLQFRATLPDTTLGRDVATLARQWRAGVHELRL